MAFFGSSPAKSASPSFGGASASGGSSFGSARKTGADFFGSSQNSSTPSFAAPPEQSEAPTFGAPPEQSEAPNFSSAPPAGSDFFGDEPAKTESTPFFLITEGNDGFLPTEFEARGNVNVDKSDGNRTPIELVTDPSDQDFEEIATFTGFGPDSLRELIERENPTIGSVVKLTFEASDNPQTVSFFYEFETTESISSPTDTFNDYSFFATSDGQIGLLADAFSVGRQGSTGVLEGTLTIAAADEDVTVYLGVLNAGDTGVVSFLRVGVEQDGESSLVLLPITEVGVALTGLPGPDVGSPYFGDDVVL